MLSNFEVIIGIENHVELKTKTKMFADSPVFFGATANTKVNEIDLGYPGAMPSVNREGVRLAILAANVLHMKIDPVLRFDRKNYFYPDLVKGFQITQQFFPLGRDGYLDILSPQITKRIGIERLHIEEDTAKQTHEGSLTLIDYNRSGIGLIEIVSCPEISSANEAVLYVEKLREILLFLRVSDVKMSEGSLRCDVNISLRPIGTLQLGNKVEIKNINSFANVRKAIEFEIARQNQILLQNQTVKQETRRFDEATQTTVAMRSKKDAIDYRYIPEPNILPIKLDLDWIDKVIKNTSELADAKRQRFVQELGLKPTDVDILLTNLELTVFFEETLKYCISPGKALNYLLSDIQAELNKQQINITQTKLTPKNFGTMVNLLENNIISTKHAKTILPIILKDNMIGVEEIIENLNLKLISDEGAITEHLKKIINNNLELVGQYAKRPERVIKTIMGTLMKESHGNINPDFANKVLKKLLANLE